MDSKTVGSSSFGDFAKFHRQTILLWLSFKKPNPVLEKHLTASTENINL
jgi:hypothetical protein